MQCAFGADHSQGKIAKAEVFLTLLDVAATNGPEDTLVAQAQDLASKAAVQD